jgi:hypothetical protein
MNVSRQKIMESVTKILEQDRIRSVFAGIRDEKERERVSASISGVIKMFTALGGPGEQFAELFADMTSLMDPVMSEGFQQLVPFAGEAAMSLADLARRAKAGELSPEQQIDGVMKFGAALDQQRDTITQMAAMGDEGARRAASMLLQYDEAQERYKLLRKVGETFEGYMKRQGESAAEAAKSGVLLDDALKRVRVGFDRLLTNFFNTVMGSDGAVNAMDTLADLGTNLGDVFNRMSNWLENFFDENKDKDLVERLTILGGKIFTVLLTDVIGPAIATAFKAAFSTIATYIVGGLAAVFAAQALKTAVGARFTGSPVPGPGSLGAAGRYGGVAALAIGSQFAPDLVQAGSDAIGLDEDIGRGIGDVAGKAMQGAMLGMMLGPKGALVGAAVGGLYGIGSGLYEHFTKPGMQQPEETARIAERQETREVSQEQVATSREQTEHIDRQTQSIVGSIVETNNKLDRLIALTNEQNGILA